MVPSRGPTDRVLSVLERSNAFGLIEKMTQRVLEQQHQHQRGRDHYSIADLVLSLRIRDGAGLGVERRKHLAVPHLIGVTSLG